MEVVKALIINQNTSVKINKLNNIVETTNKLLNNDDRELIEWWTGLNEVWQYIFLKKIDEKLYYISYSHLFENRNYYIELIEYLKLPNVNDLMKIIELEEIIIDDYGVSFKNIKTFKPLEKLKKIKTLKIRNIIKIDLSSLNNLKSLKELTIIKTRVGGMEFISELTNLEKLTLNVCEIKDLTQLNALVKLNYLYLGVNKIIDITPISNLINLEYLNLNGNEINDGEPVKYLTKLRHLDLRGNKLNSIENFIYFFEYLQLFFFDSYIYNKKYIDKNIESSFWMKLN